ncbi:MAG: leucine-rich repeat domain-containing protein, partial [Muribaculaceae bacterium]|nr:leucine-rich repeat domain-containing protein [Muribaculaceae bacterium]
MKSCRLYLLVVSALLAMSAEGRTFRYDGIEYEVIDEASQTCRTKPGVPRRGEPGYGNFWSGTLVLPAHPLDGDKEFTLTEIGENGFKNNPDLKEVVLPSTLTAIRASAFYRCEALGVLDMTDSGLIEIGENAFWNCGIQTLAFPPTLARIGDGAFDSCYSLVSVTVPNSIESIGSKAFGFCDRLTELKSTGEYGESTGVICDGAFGECHSLVMAIVPASVTEIGMWAFQGCRSMTNVIIPDGVTSIGERSFGWCEALRVLKLPSALQKIGPQAFRGCVSLGEIKVPSLVDEIGEYAFAECSGLTSIGLPDTLTEFGEYAFSGCSS